MQFVCAIFSNDVNISIKVGFGDGLGLALDGATGKSASTYDLDEGYSYYQLHQALVDHGVSDQMLPPVDPTDGQNFIVPKVQARALGLFSTPPSSGFDGSAIFSSAAIFDYSTVGQVDAGKISFVGVVEHELSEIMGRVGVGPSSSNYNATILSLYRYSGAGVLALGTAADSYFSTDRGVTLMASFNNPYSSSGGDFGDWASSAGRDVFWPTLSMGQ